MGRDHTLFALSRWGVKSIAATRIASSCPSSWRRLLGAEPPVAEAAE